MPSFDVVSQVDMQEVRNAVDQAAREITNRFDFKGTGTSVRLTDDGISLESNAESRLEAAIDVLKGRLVKRKRVAEVDRWWRDQARRRGQGRRHCSPSARVFPRMQPRSYPRSFAMPS